MTDPDLTFRAVSDDLRAKTRTEVSAAGHRLATISTLPGMTRPSSTGHGTEPTPLARRLIARAMRNAWWQEEHTGTRLARQEGVSWDELGVSDGYGPGNAEKAFDRAAGEGYLGHPPSLAWRCGSEGGCGELVIDHGPADGHPSDCESGHAEGCARHAAEIAAWQARRDDED